MSIISKMNKSWYIYSIEYSTETKKLTSETHISIYEYHQHAFEVLNLNTEESMLCDISLRTRKTNGDSSCNIGCLWRGRGCRQS